MGISQEKLFLMRLKKRALMSGLEFDSTAVGALKSTLNRCRIRILSMSLVVLLIKC